MIIQKHKTEIIIYAVLLTKYGADAILSSVLYNKFRSINMQRIKFFTAIAVVSFFLSASMPFESKPVVKKTSRTGDIEILEAEKDGKSAYKIIYTYSGKLKVRGEYWEVIDKKNAKKAQSNILAGTAMAKKYEAILAGKKIADQANVQLDIEKDGYVLKNVRIVQYNGNGKPVLVMARGYTSYPVLGVFNLKTDYSYIYDQAGKLIEIKETNMNVDSLLLNLGVGNITKITWDDKKRPLSIKKEIESVPPAAETTSYTYEGTTDNMQKTVYQKCSMDTRKLSIVPSQTITLEYDENIPWSGMKKYNFEIGKTVKSIKIYDEVNKKQILNISNFKKLSFIEKGKVSKSIYDMYKNEQQGPRWRIGELPDIPEPFMIYKDYAWWN